MSQSPKVGITTGYKDGRQGVDHAYIQAIETAGGIPIIMPMVKEKATAQAIVSLLDGLVITGGPGIIEGLVGELPDDINPVDPIRYDSDTLLYASLEQQPVLGICYGMQFINAKAGGTIYADLANQVESANIHSPKRGAEPHPVRIETDTHLANILKQDEMTVNTYHIQSVAEIGAGLRVNAMSPDGIIEGVETADGQRIGVQFHPERMLDDMLPLFQDFIARCRKDA